MPLPLIPIGLGIGEDYYCMELKSYLIAMMTITSQVHKASQSDSLF